MFAIESQAPTRIDLCGGTIDIWPLYLFHESADTINLAINLYAKTRIEQRSDGRFIIESIDLKKRISFDSIEDIRHNHPLSLATRAIRFFKPESGLYIETDCESPPGAGLAGSSALNISLCSALNKITGNKYSKNDVVTIAKNIEAQVINIPTGDQDYYPAMFGGLHFINLSIEGVRAERFKIDNKEFERRITLCYSGSSRNSGINNWEIFKRHIDGNRKIFRNLESIKKTADKMKLAIIDSDFKMIGRLIGEEWRNRKNLWKGVSTPQIERLIAIAEKNGAISAKVCGAGGGGCLIFFSEPDRQEDIKATLKKTGARILNYRIDNSGVKINPF
jgi:D-glycero-alpha-D-manno-heptose-7-phosphate kinase